jgi:hypothetical protein
VLLAVPHHTLLHPPEGLLARSLISSYGSTIIIQ